MGTAGYSDHEITHFLERLAADVWIEIKDRAQTTSVDTRLTSVGRALAEVMCKDVE